MSGTHTTRSVNGGYFTAPNRWFDAGYARALKPSVTIVFMFIRRWADVNNGLPSQPIKTIATQCGLTEKVVREAVQTLESIGVIKRLNNENQHTQSVWEIYDLAEHFDSATVEIGDGRKAPPSQKTAPLKTTPHYQPEYINNESNDSSVSVSDETSTGAPIEPEAPYDLNSYPISPVGIPSGEALVEYGRKELPPKPPTPFQLAAAALEAAGSAIPLGDLPQGEIKKQCGFAKRLITDKCSIDEAVSIVRWLRENHAYLTSIDIQTVMNWRTRYLIATGNDPRPKVMASSAPANPIITQEEMAAPWTALRESMMAQHQEKKAREAQERAEYEQHYI